MQYTQMVNNTMDSTQMEYEKVMGSISMQMVIVMRVILEIIRNMGLGNLRIKIRASIMVWVVFIFLGQWENGMKHGEGTYSYQNKDTYSGQWMFNKKNGQGSY